MEWLLILLLIAMSALVTYILIRLSDSARNAERGSWPPGHVPPRPIPPPAPRSK